MTDPSAQTMLALVDKIRSGSHDGWGYSREECAEFIRQAIAAPAGEREKEITRLATIEECARLVENTGLRNPDNIARDLRTLAHSRPDRKTQP